MKKIGLLLPHDYKLFSVAAILDVFETVNGIYTTKKKEPPFVITIIQCPDAIEQYGKSFYGYPVKSPRSALQADLVLLPAFSSANLQRSVEKNRALIPWLQKQYKAGAEMASFCTGAYLFAASGLLDGKLATTHMDACPSFIVEFPRVFVKPGRTVTIDGNCYTSGGSTSAFHLLVFLIQKYCGNELAVRVSKIFAIDLDRYQQSYFSTFRPDYSHSDDLVKKIQQAIETNYLTITTIDEIARLLPASRRNIVRRFKRVTGVPPVEYLQHTRIEKAKKLLEQTDHTISEVITHTGYADPKSFRKVFLKLVGITPLEYREKFKVK